MKKEYIRPEAELMRFVETEEIMTENNMFTANSVSTEIPSGYNWGL